MASATQNMMPSGDSSNSRLLPTIKSLGSSLTGISQTLKAIESTMANIVRMGSQVASVLQNLPSGVGPTGVGGGGPSAAGAQPSMRPTIVTESSAGIPSMAPAGGSLGSATSWVQPSMRSTAPVGGAEALRRAYQAGGVDISQPVPDASTQEPSAAPQPGMMKTLGAAALAVGASQAVGSLINRSPSAAQTIYSDNLLYNRYSLQTGTGMKGQIAAPTVFNNAMTLQGHAGFQGVGDRNQALNTLREAGIQNWTDPNGGTGGYLSNLAGASLISGESATQVATMMASMSSIDPMMQARLRNRGINSIDLNTGNPADISTVLNQTIKADKGSGFTTAAQVHAALGPDGQLRKTLLHEGMSSADIANIAEPAYLAQASLGGASIDLTSNAFRKNSNIENSSIYKVSSKTAVKAQIDAKQAAGAAAGLNAANHAAQGFASLLNDVNSELGGLIGNLKGFSAGLSSGGPDGSGSSGAAATHHGHSLVNDIIDTYAAKKGFDLLKGGAGLVKKLPIKNLLKLGGEEGSIEAGGLAGGLGGVGGLLGGVAGQLITHIGKHNGKANKAARMIGDTVSGAATGAGIASFLGPEAIPVGALIGGGIGFVKGGGVGTTLHAANSLIHNVFGGSSDSAPYPKVPSGFTWPEIEQVANGKGAPPHGVSSTYRPGGSSYHARGEAVDFVGPSGPSIDSPELLAINQFWAKNYGPELAELIYAGPGGTCIKNGRVVSPGFYGAATMAEHHNHVHVAAVPGALKGLSSVGPGTYSATSGRPSSSDAGSNPSTSGNPNSGNPNSASLMDSSSSDAYARLAGMLGIDTSSTQGPNLGGGTATSGGTTSTIGNTSVASVSNPGGAVGDGGSGGMGTFGNRLPRRIGNPPASLTSAMQIGQRMAAAKGWTGNEWLALYRLWENESSWNPNAKNSSGAYGIPEASGHGHPYNLGDPSAQVAWGLNYIAGRYKDPIGAWDHELKVGWYDKGSWRIRKDEMAVVHKDEMVLPKNIAGPVRDAIANGGGGSGCNVTIQVSVASASESEVRRFATMTKQLLEHDNHMKSVASV